MKAPADTRRVVVTGGGTAGHILPALEFFDAYRREFNATGCFVGCGVGLESRLVPSRGVRLEVIPGVPWAREKWFGQIRAGACLPPAIRAARRILVREKAEIVIGTGGYASFSTCIAAYTLGVPVVIHEANAEPGMANKILDRFASLVCVGSPEGAAHFHRPVVVSGVPAGDIVRSRPPVGPPWKFLVLGGSEGSPLLNDHAPLLFAELRRKSLPFTVRHLAGLAGRPSIERAYAAAGVTAQVDGFVDAMAPVYAGAALAITSAGARTLAELAAAGVPSLLVPLPGAARNHQVANARLYSSRAGANLIIEEPWKIASVAARIEELVGNPVELHDLARRVAAWAQPNAARDMVRICESHLFARRPAESSAVTVSASPDYSVSNRAGSLDLS